MFSKGLYSDRRENEIKEIIRSDGFEPTKFSDTPGYVYTPHTHPETKLLAFLDGSMEVVVANEIYNCVKGDRLIIPGNILHSAVVGKDGCVFFWSEKLL